MKSFRIFVRSIRDAFKSVSRNFSLSLASISCITITLIIVAIAIMFSLNVNNFAKLIKEDVSIVIHINPDVESSKLGTIKAKLEQIDNIAKIECKDKNQIKEEMQSTSNALNEIMENWDESENPLMDTFVVTVKDIEKIETTAKEISDLKEVEFTDYGAGMVNRMLDAFEFIEKITIIAVIALLLVTFFLIINTIKLTIFSRKREISIMRLVGASNFTIKMPFVVEGIILGFLGSLIPILLIIYGYFGLYNNLNGNLYSPLFKLVEPTPFIYVVSIIVLVIGIVVGMIGSYRAVRKYLKI
ncbi:MAG: ABC transporter permease [Firmicutes bacterium]|nr:ABC transporter permease [Bacillota bacterium]